MIPKKLWMFWGQGLANAPYLVQKCIDSWRKQNPTWELTVLDESQISQYVTQDPAIRYSEMTWQQRSEMLRLALLRDYGGVWADATAFCVAPLDDWIDEHSLSGFFAYARPAPDRLLSSWFLASVQGGSVATKLYHQLANYYRRPQFRRPNFFQEQLVKVLGHFFNRNVQTARRWLSPVVMSLPGVCPYFIFQYQFARLVATDSEVRCIWENTVKVTADKPHLVQFKYGFNAPVTDEIKRVIDGGTIPMFKLNHRFDQRSYLAGTVLYYLLEGMDCVAKNPVDMAGFFG